ncbi:MAG: error-prone DNA polymerase [Gammaproteobacteria bacterium]|nr:MAG: error-prone DNA polymerase [Gammaproteobacteria bacterium]
MEFSANGMLRYAELHCLSNFTFLRGASHPEEQVKRAAELGYSGLALTDECSLAGVVRAHSVARKLPLQLIIGSEFKLDNDLKMVVLAADRKAYGALTALISCGRRAADKGSYHLTRDDVSRCLGSSENLILWLPAEDPDLSQGAWVKESFPDRVWLATELLVNGQDRHLLKVWTKTAKVLGIPMVASGNVHMHCRERRRLQDTVTAIRLKVPLERAGFELYPNGERFLRSLEALARGYPVELLKETLAITERIHFSLDELRYEYPHDLIPVGETPASHLRALTEKGMRWRWPHGAPDKVLKLIEHELELIAELCYEPYFLTVHDIVQFARSEHILCQGRGSAANSAVCYCLGITEVDPARMEMLMERFISKERNEPPDIDVDFEHERREEVIQYIYKKYSRERAALAATVISYRARSAVRDVGKALGLDELQVNALAKSLQRGDGRQIGSERVREAGLDPASPVVHRLLTLVSALIGFPRHLSQHVGGFVISQGILSELAPIENAAMPNRTVIQWDKNDLEELGLLKVDVLGLGILSAIRRSFDLIQAFYGRELSMSNLPPEDPAVYEMISRADTVGVFQIESRAQMAMLPRLKPKCYYDLVIEVAIIRPGPIQGGMVHPYLRRRDGKEPVSYPSPQVEQVLKRTLGVPIFQEQVMKLAVVAAGFTPGEADDLRRAMAAWRRGGGLERFEQRLIQGMLDRGYTGEFAERIFKQIKGFGEYGFPESHAASFALLVYVSAWLKCHEPAVFFCALLNSQPMGFYAPAQLIRSARKDGVEVRPVDIYSSDWDSTLERNTHGDPVLRLGLHLVKGLSAAGAEQVIGARRTHGFTNIQDLAEQTGLGRKDLNVLAASGALKSLATNRHRARWDIAGVQKPTPLFPQIRIPEGTPLLRIPTEGQNIAADYRHLGFTLGRHPLALLRTRLIAMHIEQASLVTELAHGTATYVAGLVITRQRPSSAAGVTFVTIEDETGYLNLVVWERLAKSQRSILLGATLLGVKGHVQKEGEVVHVVADRLYDHSALLGSLPAQSRDFH